MLAIDLRPLTYQPHIRLALEEARDPYEDTASQERKPSLLCPSVFRHGDLFISQTSNVLMYLGPRLGLSDPRENEIYRVNALALIALDGLSNMVHDTHHLISQRRGLWLLGESFTYADIYCLDGIQFAFPRALNHARESGKYNSVFKLCKAVSARPDFATYMASDKRQKYTQGIYRYYEQNDVVAEG
ncbi:putative glutathione S-transferase family protein [Xylariaceae sp. FL1651]|nr:putative glutathione S-transferase family protein [Xylariaceae sp. FL1651]